LYRGRYDKPTPPGYSGIAFAPHREDQTAEKSLKKSPTPVENGAGEDQIRQDTNAAGRLLEEILQSRPRVSQPSKDSRNEIKTLPRNFSGAVQEESNAQETAKFCDSSKHDENGEGYALLSSLFQRKVSLEDLLLLGTALLLATKEEKGEAFPMFALALMLLGS